MLVSELYPKIDLGCLLGSSFSGASSPQWARVSSFTRVLDHIKWRTTVGRASLDEISARLRDLYLTTHNTHNRQTSMPPVGFEPTISASVRPQTYPLDRKATGTGSLEVETEIETLFSPSSLYNPPQSVCSESVNTLSANLHYSYAFTWLFSIRMLLLLMIVMMTHAACVTQTTPTHDHFAFRVPR